MQELEIYFRDFNTETQKEILKAYKIKSPEEMNWDIIPLTTLVIEEEVK